jgi:hypothetical protein
MNPFAGGGYRCARADPASRPAKRAMTAEHLLHGNTPWRPRDRDRRVLALRYNVQHMVVGNYGAVRTLWSPPAPLAISPNY